MAIGGELAAVRRLDSDLCAVGKRVCGVEDRKAGVEGVPRSCGGLSGMVVGSADTV